MRATTAFLALALCAAIVVVAAVASALWAVLAFGKPPKLAQLH